MNSKRVVYALLVSMLFLTSVSKPAVLASPAIAPSSENSVFEPGSQSPASPQSLPGPLADPKPTIQLNIDHGYVGQAINVSGTVPAPTYTAVRIAWLFDDTTYTAALVERDTNLNYSTQITIPLSHAGSQAKVCAALTNEPNAEFACSAFTLDIPPAGSISGNLLPGQLLSQSISGIHSPAVVPAIVGLADHAGTLLYTSTVAPDGSFSISGVDPGIYILSFTGGIKPGLPPKKVVVEPGTDTPIGSSVLVKGWDPVTHLPCISNFNAQVGWTKANTSDTTFGYVGKYSELTSYGDLFSTTYDVLGAIAGRDYDFGVYLEGVSLPVIFRTGLQIDTGVSVDGVQYHLQKPDGTIVLLGSSSSAGDYYSLTHDVKDLPKGRSKLIVAPVAGGLRQCPQTFTIQVDVDPMKDDRLQPGASTTWNSATGRYDFQGTLISAGGKLPFTYPTPIPDLKLIGKVENSFNAGIYVEGDIRLNGVVHIKIGRAIAKAKIFSQSVLDKSQDLIDDSVAHIYTDMKDWHNTKVVFVPVKLWDDYFSTDVYKGPMASFWGIVTINASLSVGLGGQVTLDGTIYPFQPNLTATMHSKVTPNLTVSIWVDILLGIASAGADANVATSFSMPLRLDTRVSDNPTDWVWMDTPCFSFKITLSAWARVNLIYKTKTWNIGSYELLNYSNPEGCTALARAVLEVAPDAVLLPPHVMASPAVASSASGEILSAYILDTTPASNQATPTVMASFFDSGPGVWKTASAISDGLHNVQDPAVGFIGQTQTPIVVWTQTDLTLAQEEAADDSINTFLNKQEIYYRLWNSNTNSWDPEVRLTNNNLPDGRAAISGDFSGATLAWTVNTSGVVTNTLSLRIQVTDWDPQSGGWGTVYTLNGNGVNPAMNAQVSVARGPNLKALAWTMDVDGDISTNGDRYILAAREAANDWGTVNFDNMGAQHPWGGESPSLAIDPLTGLLHMAFLVRGKDSDGVSDTGIGNRAMLYYGQADDSCLWSYQMMSEQGSPLFAEKPVLLIGSNGEESLIFRRFGAAGTNGLLGQIMLLHMPPGGSFFSAPGYLTDDPSQHYQLAAALNPVSPGLMVLAVNRAAISPEVLSAVRADSSLGLTSASPYQTAFVHLQKLTAADDPVESLVIPEQADLALQANPVLSIQHAQPGASVAITITLRNLGLGAALNTSPAISVCLYNGLPLNGSNQIGCQDLPANLNLLNYNDSAQFVFNVTRTAGLQPFIAHVTSNGFNGSAGNDIAVGALGAIPAPLLTAVFIDASLPNAIGVQWLPPVVADLGGFRILRSMTPGGPYELVGETTDTYMPDLLLHRGQLYCYVVQAFDDAGVLSSYSSEACEMVPLLTIYLPLIKR